jgi:hypothetical protein
MTQNLNQLPPPRQLTSPSSADVIPLFQPKPRSNGGYLRLDHYFLNSSAYQSLSPVERALYIDIASKFNGHNNGRISYSIRDGMAALHASSRTARRALKQLQRLGLIVRTKHGFFDPETRQAKASTWYLPEYGGTSEAVATTGQCLGSSGHQCPQAVATRDTKNIDKEVKDKKDKIGNLVSEKEVGLPIEPAAPKEVKPSDVPCPVSTAQERFLPRTGQPLGPPRKLTKAEKDALARLAAANGGGL